VSLIQKTKICNSEKYGTIALYHVTFIYQCW